MTAYDVVVVGAGQAAVSCVARLRSGGYAGTIAVLGAEPAPPYQRPALSKAYLLGEITRERLYLRPESYYAEAGIILHTDCRVDAIDPAARLLRTAAGDQIAYHHLVLATGSRARKLPAAMGGALDGVYTVRDLADAKALAPRLVPGARVLVVGGGYVGLEAAAVCAKRGLAVTLIEAAPRLLQRVAAAETARWFRTLHEAHGVTILEGAALQQLTGDSHVTGACLADGRVLPADLIIVGIGIEPETMLAAAAGLALDNGIVVNGQGRTSAAGIWAAGDCAAFPAAGGWMRLESVGNAIDMGEIVARNILGEGVDYLPAPWFWSDQYDIKLQIAGLNTGHDQVVPRQDEGRSHWYFVTAPLAPPA